MKPTKDQEFYKTIVQKAWEDENFKQELIKNPIIAIEKTTGEKLNLSEGENIEVVDQTDDSVIYINIPAKPNMENIELSEEQLEAVAGGTYIPSLLWTLPDFSKWRPGEDGGSTK